MHEIDHLVAELVAGQSFHEGEHANVVEAPELDTVHTRLSAQRAQHLHERMRRRELRIAERPDHEHTGGFDVGHNVVQKLQAWLVRPMQVLEHDHHRLHLRRLGEQSHHRAVQQVTLRIRISARRFRELPETLSQRRDHPRELTAVRGDVRRAGPLLKRT